MTRPYTPVSAPRGTELSCKSWPAEAALRMLMNSLDPAVAADPEQGIVHGSAGKAMRSWDDFDAAVAALKELEPDETLVVQSGRPVAVFRTHLLAPRVVMTGSLLVPAWSSAEEFRALETAGLTITGDMTASAWIHVGPQSGACTAWEAFRSVADEHFGGTLEKRLIASAGLGGLGAGQAPAANALGAAMVVAEIDADRVSALSQANIVHHSFGAAGAAIDKAVELKEAGSAETVVFTGHAVELLAALKEKGVTPDIVTDLTPAHDPLGYTPRGMSLADARTARSQDAPGLEKKAAETAAEHVGLMLELAGSGAIAFEFGNNLRGQAELGGLATAFELPGVVPKYLRQQFTSGRRPLVFVALSGEQDDLEAIDEVLADVGDEDARLQDWLSSLGRTGLQCGLPARVAWLRSADQLAVGKAINRKVRDQDINAPVVIARDQFDPGHVASPFRETEQMPDNSDAIADWAVLGALLNSAAGATWVSVTHGGGTGIGFSVHGAMAIVCNGSPEADERLDRVLTVDPGLGLVRYVEAKDAAAMQSAQQAGITMPRHTPAETGQ